MGDREILETYLNSASKNTSETDIFPNGTKPLLTSVIEVDYVAQPSFNPFRSSGFNTKPPFNSRLWCGQVVSSSNRLRFLHCASIWRGDLKSVELPSPASPTHITQFWFGFVFSDVTWYRTAQYWTFLRYASFGFVFSDLMWYRAAQYWSFLGYAWFGFVFSDLM